MEKIIEQFVSAQMRRILTGGKGSLYVEQKLIAVSSLLFAKNADEGVAHLIRPMTTDDVCQTQENIGHVPLARGQFSDGFSIAFKRQYLGKFRLMAFGPLAHIAKQGVGVTHGQEFAPGLVVSRFLALQKDANATITQCRRQRLGTSERLGTKDIHGFGLAGFWLVDAVQTGIAA